MKTEPNDLARPHAIPRKVENGVVVEYDQHLGLTKREYFAGLAMQGLLTAGDSVYPKNETAKEAVQIADALITALNS